MKLKFAMAAAGLFLSIAGAQAVTLGGSDWLPAMRSEALNVAQCIGGRRCTGYYVNGRGVRVCRGYVACRPNAAHY
jgi:hypothetical protein